MNSPQPLSALQAGSFAKIAHRAIFKRSALQRGAKGFTPPSFACKRRGLGGIVVNQKILFRNECASIVSPPFEGGVAGTIDYLMFTRFFPRPGWLIKLILTDSSNGDFIKYRRLRTRIILLDYEV